MTERAVGYDARNSTEYVAAFVASEEADGHTRLIQIMSVTAGKVDEDIGDPYRIVSTNDSMDVDSLSGNLEVGDNSYLTCYIHHSEPTGSCLITPLLCDNNGVVVGTLEPRQSNVCLTMQSGTGYYMSNNINWDIKGTGAYSIFPHVSNLSSSNIVKLWVFSI